MAALDFLRKELEDGRKPAKTMLEKAEAYGIASRTLDRARKELGVEASKVEKVWYWSLP